VGWCLSIEDKSVSYPIVGLQIFTIKSQIIPKKIAVSAVADAALPAASRTVIEYPMPPLSSPDVGTGQIYVYRRDKADSVAVVWKSGADEPAGPIETMKLGGGFPACNANSSVTVKIKVMVAPARVKKVEGPSLVNDMDVMVGIVTSDITPEQNRTVRKATAPIHVHDIPCAEA